MDAGTGVGSGKPTERRTHQPSDHPLSPTRSGRVSFLALGLLLVVGAQWLSGCAMREQVRRICLDVEASQDLNFYDGEAHTLTLLVYALADSTGFQAAPISELLSGYRPAGVLEPPAPLTVDPGSKLNWEEVFPAATRSVGVVADYDREPGAADATEHGLGQRVVLPTRCGFMAPRLKLGQSRIEDS